jgi:hypothetical protein
MLFGDACLIRRCANYWEHLAMVRAANQPLFRGLVGHRLPEDIGNCVSLTHLDVHDNRSAKFHMSLHAV